MAALRSATPEGRAYDSRGAFMAKRSAPVPSAEPEGSDDLRPRVLAGLFEQSTTSSHDRRLAGARFGLPWSAPVLLERRGAPDDRQACFDHDERSAPRIRRAGADRRPLPRRSNGQRACEWRLRLSLPEALDRIIGACTVARGCVGRRRRRRGALALVPLPKAGDDLGRGRRVRKQESV